MLKIIYDIKKVVPPPMWKAIATPYWWWYNRARHQLAGVVNPRRMASVRAIRSFENCHRGERCFILGNGPSLMRTDIARLRREITFGMNRIYLLFDDIGFSTNYYVAINTLVIEQCAGEIKRLPMPKFITWRARRWMAADPGTIFIDTDYTPPESFSEDPTGRVFEGSTVTYVALQMAYYMGFEEVILIGVDHQFSTQGTPNVTIVSQGEDPDHFTAGYFGKGFRWQLPDLAASERAYALARKAFEAGGRRVLDATIGGKLEVFPKVDYGSLF